MSRIIIAQYRGLSLTSRKIKGRGLYSHTAAVLQDNTVVESWVSTGVTHVDRGYGDNGLIYNLSANHTPGTKIDLFYISCTQEQADLFEKLVLAEVGKPYDFWSIWCFITRTAAAINGKWFCSELHFDKLAEVGIWLHERIESWEVSPNLMGISVKMIPYDQVVTV